MNRTDSGSRRAHSEPGPDSRTARQDASAERRLSATGSQSGQSRPRVLSGNIRSVEQAFYELAGQGSYVATAATAGPWSPDAQHGGPPSALAVRALEQHEPD